MVTQVVQYSTGAGSAEVARRVVDEHGAEATVLLTADTRVEDDDNWRFASEVWESLGRPEWVRLADGRTPMEVGLDERVVPNNRMAVCSKILKRKLLRRYVEERWEPSEIVLHFGFDWTETHRLDAARPHWAPWTIDAPLVRPPYLTKADLLETFRSAGIEPPRLYAEGFSHANCGGACVRGGQAQWELLLRTHPDRFRAWEADEEKIRSELGRDVSILRDRRGGDLKPLTLRSFRVRLEGQPGLFDAEEWGACGCTEDAP